MKTTLTDGRYAGNLEFIGKLLLEGGYQSFIDWLLEQDETRQLDVVYMMALFAKETSVLVSEKSRGEKSPATLATQSLKVRSPGLKGIDEAAKEIKSKPKTPKLTLISNKVVPFKRKDPK